MAFLLWMIVVVRVGPCIVTLFHRQALHGLVLIIVGLLIGTGGVGVFA